MLAGNYNAFLPTTLKVSGKTIRFNGTTLGLLNALKGANVPEGSEFSWWGVKRIYRDGTIVDVPGDWEVFAIRPARGRLPQESVPVSRVYTKAEAVTLVKRENASRKLSGAYLLDFRKVGA